MGYVGVSPTMVEADKVTPMRRTLALACALVVTACGGSAAPTTVTTIPVTTTTTAATTTAAATTSTTIPPATTTTAPDFAVPQIDAVEVAATDAGIDFGGVRPVASGGEPGAAEAIQAVLDAHLAAEQARVAASGFVGEVTFAYEVLTAPYTVALRLVTDTAPAAPAVATVTVMTFRLADGDRLRLTDLDGLSEETLSTAVLSRVYEQLLEVIGDAAAVDAVFGGAGLASGDRFAITTTGIEITVTEADGLPAGFGVVTTAISWETVPEPAW